ncbi:G2/mitotic-specific cyclin C13-1-like [Triticum dicoccoides]|uniref:G2/mitotic-specific cyclin C13-1-like n=1 Tax=Triticum dicoccoides TaxID=85692 RepID=UPI00188E1E50|nr:G2/mitotic-specific cyclin C13-1-like [Triticum dicoccoides]
MTPRCGGSASSSSLMVSGPSFSGSFLTGLSRELEAPTDELPAAEEPEEARRRAHEETKCSYAASGNRGGRSRRRWRAPPASSRPLKGQPRTAKPPIVSTSSNASATLRPSPRASKQTTRPPVREDPQPEEDGGQRRGERDWPRPLAGHGLGAGAAGPRRGRSGYRAVPGGHRRRDRGRPRPPAGPGLGAAGPRRAPGGYGAVPRGHRPVHAVPGGEGLLDSPSRPILRVEASRRPRDDYIWTTQEDINPKMRAVLVDWLVDVACTFRLPADTLHLAVSYVDRFLTTSVIKRHELQLLGVTALLVAAKYEDDIFVHEVQRYRGVTGNTYTAQQVVKMETDILKSLNFEMGSPTARTFLRRYITVCRGRDRAKAEKLEFLCSYLAELSLLDYDCIQFNPSVVAAAYLFLARFTISPTAHPWNLTLQRNTKYKVSDLKSCILMIHELQLNGTYPGLKEDAVKVKYNDRELEGVSAMASPKNMPPRFLKNIRR